MITFEQYIAENFGNMSVLPHDLARFLTVNANDIRFGQNSVVEPIHHPNANSLNKQVNEITKRLGEDPNNNIYLTWVVRGYVTSRYNYDTHQREEFPVDVYVVLKKFSTRDSSWFYSANYIHNGRHHDSVPEAIGLGRGYGRDLPKKVKLVDLDFSKVDTAYVIYMDHKRSQLRHDRYLSQQRNDPLAKSAYDPNAPHATTVDRQNANVLVFNKMIDAERALKEAIQNTTFISVDSDGTQKFSLDKFITQLNSIRNKVSGYSTSYQVTQLPGKGDRVSLDELKKVLRELETWKNNIGLIK